MFQTAAYFNGMMSNSFSAIQHRSTRAFQMIHNLRLENRVSKCHYAQISSTEVEKKTTTTTKSKKFIALIIAALKEI